MATVVELDAGLMERLGSFVDTSLETVVDDVLREGWERIFEAAGRLEEITEFTTASAIFEAHRLSFVTDLVDSGSTEVANKPDATLDDLNDD